MEVDRRKLLFLWLFAPSALGQDPTRSNESANSMPGNPVSPDWSDESLTPMERTLRLAQWSGRPILAVAHGEWCGPHRVLRNRLLNDPKVAPLASLYVIYYMDSHSEEYAD